MNKIYVFADFDWFDRPQLVGELNYDTVRGNEKYGFSFTNKWLAEHGDLFLSDDLQPFRGIQYTAPGQDIFSCFSDALPNRWGRTLINRREQMEALEQNRPVRRLSSFDYLIGIDDTSRMGGLRFKNSLEGGFINSEEHLKVPPIAHVRDLMHAAHEIEKSDSKNLLPARKWIDQLINPGTSLGGARPKASIIDEKGQLTVAKFPSQNDEYDIAKWEHFSHLLGAKAGINTAETRLIPGNQYNILLSKRFDRTQFGKRIHFASSLTLLGLKDGDNSSTGFGYTDIVDFIITHGAEVEKNLEELYRRVAFYIMIGNSDDHFRNHGFILDRKGWVLSPAYDINPTVQSYQTLLINRTTNESNLDLLKESYKDYLLKEDKAKKIIEEVKGAVKDWHKLAKMLNLPQRDIEIFAPVFERWLN